jgi:hypothetical protein
MLITLALNLMQEQVMEKVSWVAKEIGMTGDGNTNEEVVKITKADRLKHTPSDMTGNELDFNEKRARKAEEDHDEQEQHDDEVPPVEEDSAAEDEPQKGEEPKEEGEDEAPNAHEE